MAKLLHAVLLGAILFVQRGHAIRIRGSAKSNLSLDILEPKHSDPTWFRVTRQGEEIFSGRDLDEYSFDKHLHQEFVLETTELGEMQRSLLYVKSTDTCGVGLFTRKKLTCSK